MTTVRDVYVVGVGMIKFGRYPDQDISLADAVNAEISERLGVTVWTYDHHFDVMGTGVWRR